MADVDEKVYTPQVIKENPLPGEDSASINQTDSSVSTSNPKNEIYSQNEISNNAVPVRQVALETTSNRINTITGKILGKFDFGPSGAIKIGDYKEGEFGEIKISPSGILALDKYGETSFGVDGETGNAYFRGEVRAKDFVIADEQGLVSLANFHHIVSVKTISQRTTSSTDEEVTGVSIDFELSRPAIVMLLFHGHGSVGGDSNANYSGTGHFRIKEGSNILVNDYLVGGLVKIGSDYLYSGCGLAAPFSNHYAAEFSAGKHSIKLYISIERTSGTSLDFILWNGTITAIILGS